MTVVAIMLVHQQSACDLKRLISADADIKWLCKIVRLSQWEFYSNVFVCCNKASQFDGVAGNKKKPNNVIENPLAAINNTRALMSRGRRVSEVYYAYYVCILLLVILFVTVYQYRKWCDVLSQYLGRSRSWLWHHQHYALLDL